MNVQDGMSSVVLSIGPTHTLRDAARMMSARHVGAAVVVDPDHAGVGILTERDVLDSIGAGQNPDIELAAQQTFDLVLMDVQMPEMDGFAATAVLRARESSTASHLPIIAMTAHAMKGDAERCLEAGMDAYVAKPINPASLFALVDQVCGESNREA